jgi:hypothetical protein
MHCTGMNCQDQKYNFKYQDKAVSHTLPTRRYGLNSFLYIAAQTWNDLPNHFRQETSLEHFKNVSEESERSCICVLGINLQYSKHYRF